MNLPEFRPSARPTRSCNGLRLLGLLSFLWAAVPFPVFGAEAPESPITVAVLDFEARDELGRHFGKEVSLLVSAHLSGNPGIWTVERAELDKALAEQALPLGGMVDPASAAKVGHLTGAKVLVTGRAFHAGKELLLVAKVIGTETGRVYGEVVKSGRDAPVTGPSEDLAKRVGATITSKADSLVAKVPTPADRLAKLKEKLKDGPRPSVSVRIPEVHFGTPAVDPAAQTELAFYFKEVGCDLRDTKSAEAPDIEVTGEAFSEVGLRRAGLVSCRARVEIQVRERKSGRILLVERQTSVAVDVGEQTAAKKALQEAGAELAQRILPALLK